MKSSKERLSMNDETKKWLEYTDENLASAKVLLDGKLYNPCLQNVQQAVEKMLKACLVESQAKSRGHTVSSSLWEHLLRWA